MNIRTSFSIVILFTCFVGLSLQASSPASTSPSHSVPSSPHRAGLGIDLYNDPPYMRSSPSPPPKHVRPPSPEHSEDVKRVSTKLKAKTSPGSTDQYKNKEEENHFKAKQKARASLQKQINSLKDAEPSSKRSSRRRYH